MCLQLLAPWRLTGKMYTFDQISTEVLKKTCFILIPLQNCILMLTQFLVAGLKPLPSGCNISRLAWSREADYILKPPFCFGTHLAPSNTVALTCSCKMPYCITKHSQKYNYKVIILHYIKTNRVCNWSGTRKRTAKQAFQSLSQQ